MPNPCENSKQFTIDPFGPHYGLKHHLEIIIITKHFINNLRYQSALGCEQFGKQNQVECIKETRHDVSQQLKTSFLSLDVVKYLPSAFFIKEKKLWFPQSH